MVKKYKSSCKCLVVEKDIENYYYGIVPKNKFQSSVIGPRELECRSCLPSLSKENKRLTRPYLHWRLGYGDDTNPVSSSRNLPSLSLLERPGGFTVVGKISAANSLDKTCNINSHNNGQYDSNPYNITSKGSIFIVNPFENASGAAHFTYHTEKCKDASGVETTRTLCKPYTITSESRNYKLIKDADSKLIKVGASTYDEYLQKTGRKFVDRNLNVCDEDKTGEKCENPYYVYKPNNRQFAVQGAVSGSSRIARLKRNRNTNCGDNFQSKFFNNPHAAVKKRRTNMTNPCEIGWRKGNKTKCFKTPNNRGGGDHKRRLKPARPYDEYVIEITEEECEFKFIKIFNDCCVDEKGRRKRDKEEKDLSKCGGKQKCKITTKCKLIRDASGITINNALTRVRRRHNKKCFDCTRKVDCKVIKVLPMFYPPMVGPPEVKICKPPLIGVPDIHICNPPLNMVPDIHICNPPLSTVPDIHICNPPLSAVPDIHICNPPLSAVPDTSTCKPPLSTVPDTSSCKPPLSVVPDTSTCKPPLSVVPDTNICVPSLSYHPTLREMSCIPKSSTNSDSQKEEKQTEQDIVYISINKNKK